MRGRRAAIAVALGAGVLALGAAGYALADDAITTAPVGLAYAQPTFTITAGQVAQFSNTQSLPHNVTADDTKTLGGKTLFGSATVTNASANVNGTQYLAPGDYTFHCSIHGPIMSATLHVGGGTPVSRPALKLAITSTKLAAVQSSGKLKAKVSDTGSDASGVALTATLGKKTLATAKGLKVAAGASQPVSMKLSKTGAKALKGLDKATVKLGGTVDFGSAAKTTKTLK
jgi:plastocyanin